MFCFVFSLVKQTVSKLQEDLKVCRNDLHAAKETIRTLQEDLKACKNELDASKENAKMLGKEKLLLEQNIRRLEKRNTEEVFYLIMFQNIHVYIYIHKQICIIKLDVSTSFLIGLLAENHCREEF